MPPSLLRLFLSLLAFVSLATSVLAQDKEPPVRTITIIGTGEVKARPDIGIVTVGVIKRADTAAEALKQNNDAMEEIIALLRQAGIDAKDIQTTNFSVNPAYRYDNENQQPPRIIGYDVSNQVTIIVRKLDAMGSILDSVVGKGSNQIQGIAFSIDEPRPLEDEARRRALTDAQRKAKLYAEGAGIVLGPIMSIFENAPSPPIPVFVKAQRMEAAADSAVPVAQGEQVISVQISISWEIR
jgi:uncharacterized protein